MTNGLDEYGSVENNAEGAKLVSDQLLNTGAVCFSWSHNKVDAYIFILTKQFSKVGMMPFGGNPAGRIYVGLFGKGANHFCKENTHAYYWADKLNMDKGGAEAWAEFWKLIWSDL